MEHDRTSFRGAHSWRNSWPSTLIAGEAWSDMMEAHSKRWIPGTWEDAVQLCWHFSLSNCFSNSFQNHESEPSDLPTTFLYIFLPLLKFCFGDSEISIGIFVLCASNLIHISLALTIKSKFKPTLTFRSGFEATCHLGKACCKPFLSARAVVCLQSCGATQRQARPGGKSWSWQLNFSIYLLFSWWNRWWTHYESASMINEGPSWLGSR